MLNNLRAFNRKYRLIEKGDKITCAVSGGADSMALLWSLYLLKEEWDLELAAAHFNHRLRGEESDRDEYYNENTEEKGVAECIVSKNRHGETGTVKLQWIAQYQAFADREWKHAE